MSRFKPVKKPSKLKGGIFGETGAGKTFTAALILAGLHRYCKSTKPIFCFDTEGGIGYIKEKIFDPMKISVEICASTSFVDLTEGLKEAEKSAFGVIIDQETRYWDEFRKQYLKDTKRSFITIEGWGVLKPKWAEYNLLYLNTDIHIIKIGRSANIFEDTESVVHGEKKTSFMKVGTKFKSESESGYEPSLLCEMEKVFSKDDKNGEYSRILHVIKDRFDVIDSKDFVNPKFEDFLPHIERLDLVGVQSIIEQPDTKIFDFQGDDERARRARRRDILCEEMAGIGGKYFSSQKQADKKAFTQVIFDLFKVYSWKSVTDDWNAVKLERIEEVMKAQYENPDDVSTMIPSIFEQECIKKSEALQGGAVPA